MSSRLVVLPATDEASAVERIDGSSSRRWVMDPRVRRSQVEAFIADPDSIGREHLGRSLVFTTSGTTGEPAVLLQDHAVVDVFTAISLLRVAPRMLDARTLRAVVRAGSRSASVWATGRPFGGASLVRRQVLQRPSRARRLRIFSAATPVDDLVAQLNAFAPVMLSGYASALTLLAREQRAGRLAIPSRPRRAWRGALQEGDEFTGVEFTSP